LSTERTAGIPTLSKFAAFSLPSHEARTDMRSSGCFGARAGMAFSRMRKRASARGKGSHRRWEVTSLAGASDACPGECMSGRAKHFLKVMVTSIETRGFRGSFRSRAFRGLRSSVFSPRPI